VFIPDEHDVSYLLAWVRAPRQITDGQLSNVAIANSAVLATLDESVRGRIWFRNSVAFVGFPAGVVPRSFGGSLQQT